MKLTELDLGDLENFILGDKLGEGQFRDVYIFRPDPTLVIKVEKLNGEFANAHEWKVWRDLQMSPMKKFLAPCRAISGGGIFLLQERTLPIRKQDMPKKIPAFLLDEKAANWGRLGRRIVCHDYAAVYRNYGTAMRKPYSWT